MFPASSFLQIPPHDGHPCFRLYPSHYRADSGLAPVRNVRRQAHQIKGMFHSYGNMPFIIGRLLTSIDNGNATNYTYDDYHNILTKGSTTNSYNTSSTKLTNANYDSNGNTTKDSSTNTYAYDAINRMQQAVTSGVTTTYEYDSDDMISSRINTDGTTLYVLYGDQIVMELDANKNVVSKNIRGNDELLKAENADGSLKWYCVYDSHGNVVEIAILKMQLAQLLSLWERQA